MNSVVFNNDAPAAVKIWAIGTFDSGQTETLRITENPAVPMPATSWRRH
jgi:hypothetical protein